jgi:outer membrane protein TolC
MELGGGDAGMHSEPQGQSKSFQRTGKSAGHGLVFSGPWLFFALLLLAACLPLASCSPMRADPKALRDANAPQELDQIRAYAPQIESPLTLAGAIDYALKNNLQAKLAEMERAIQEEAVTGRKVAMLPSLLADAEISEKSRDVPSKSVNANTRAISLDPSISTDLDLQKAGATFTWNLLDFGVGYFRARQASNQAVMAGQRLERARQKLILEVTRAYGQAVSSREAALMARKLLSRFRERQNLALEQVQESLVSAATGLRSEIKYIEGLIQLSEFESRYSNSRAALAQLLGLPPGVDLTLADMDTAVLPMDLPLNVESMESEAIHKRPELSEKDLEQLVTEDEARVALAQIFPSPAFFLRLEHDSNSYLTVHDWYTTGLRATWNLFSIPLQLNNRKIALLKVDYLKQERTALAVAVLAQLHIAWFNYRNALEQCLLKRNLQDKHAKLVLEMEKLKLVGDINEDDYIQAMTQYFFARVQFMNAFAELLASREMVFNSLGRAASDDRGYADLRYIPPGDPGFPSLDEAMRKALAQARDLPGEDTTPQPNLGPEPGAPVGYGPGQPEATQPAGQSAAPSDQAPAMAFAPQPAEPAPAIPEAPAAPAPPTAPAEPPAPPMPDLVAMHATFVPISDIYSDRYEKLQISYFQGPDFRGIKMASTAKTPDLKLLGGSTPGQLVLDIGGRWENRGAREVDLPGATLGKVRIGSHPDKIRLVVELKDQAARTPDVLKGDGQVIMFF